MKNLSFYVSGVLALLSGTVFAAVKPSPIFHSNMVLQRDHVVPVWGTAEPGEKVTVTFAGQNVSASADAKGKWAVKLAPMKASKENRPLVIATPAGSNLFNDVLVGDVWLCSGQSNMEMSFSWGVYDGDFFRKEATNYPTIRCMKIAKRNSGWNLENPGIAAKWEYAMKRLPHCTAAGYFFARRLTCELDVPIGLIDASWSASRIEPFIASGAFEKEPEIAQLAKTAYQSDCLHPIGRENFKKNADKMREWLEQAEKTIAAGEAPSEMPPAIFSVHGGAPSVQYRAMIAPIVRFPIKGVIWYQGCSNGGESDIYIAKTKALVEGWRKGWGYDFPFYWVQLASYTAPTTDPAGGNGYARIREAQRKALAVVPKSGMAVAIDVGNPKDIHPKAKKIVGERLALWALAKDYGKDIVCSGPLFKQAVPEGDKIRVSFDSIGSGLMVGFKNPFDNKEAVAAPKGTKPEGFAIAGEDKVWAWADASIDGDTVVLSSPKVAKPLYVRYAYRACPQEHCNLYNREGLPASPFNTLP